MEGAETLINRVYKDNFGRMVASVLAISRDLDMAAAEDIVQDSFSSALSDWKEKGAPQNPAGWIYKVCRNKAINWIKREKRSTPLEPADLRESGEIKFRESVIDDYTLKLLFACAHPGLAPKVQVVITLKYVINLRVEAIAKVLGMSIDGIDKLLVRARQKISEGRLMLEEPPASLLRPRVPVVHKVLYLLFNEGYKASAGNEIIREELCEEALIMCKQLLDSPVSNHDTSALYALMLFNSARFASRFNSEGELLDLEHQDRNLWNKDLMRLGQHYLEVSRDEQVSSYHLEASIAFVHCTADTFANTDWSMITKLYGRLLHENPNPFVELGSSIALYYSGKKTEAFSTLEDLRGHSFFTQYSLLNFTLGKLHLLEGRTELAKKFLLLASSQTGFEREKRLIGRLLAQAMSDRE